MAVKSEKVKLPEAPSIDSVVYNYSFDSSSIAMDLFFKPNNDGGGYTYTVEKIIIDSVVEKTTLIDRRVRSFSDFDGEYYLSGEEYRYDADIFIVRLYSLTQAVVDFDESIRYNNNGDIGSQFSDKLPQKTNIEGGYGYFIMTAMDSVILHL